MGFCFFVDEVLGRLGLGSSAESSDLGRLLGLSDSCFTLTSVTEELNGLTVSMRRVERRSMAWFARARASGRVPRHFFLSCDNMESSESIPVIALANLSNGRVSSNSWKPLKSATAS
ncbi:hypothetical protein CPB85DRAFT_448214 [Mucidula mucida]|nr:hypothetical protein CPB85DRAFT_448214 [Mucidula mucida]